MPVRSVPSFLLSTVQQTVLLPQGSGGYGSRMATRYPRWLDRFRFEPEPTTKERTMRRNKGKPADVLELYLTLAAGGRCRRPEKRRAAARGLRFSFHLNAVEEPESDPYRHRHPAHRPVRIVVGGPGRTPSAYRAVECVAEGGGETPGGIRPRLGRRFRRGPGRIRIMGSGRADCEPGFSGATKILTRRNAGVRRRALVFFGVGASMMLAAMPAMAQDYYFLGDWPTHRAFADGTDFGVTGLYQYDVNDFSHDDGLLRDAHTNRRKYFAVYLKKNGVYDAKAEFDFQSKKWQDVFLRVQSKALFGKDIGALRIGQSKTPVGFEGNTSSSAPTFIELALPTQAVYENRRVGVDWALSRPSWLAAVGYYGGDLQGDNDGPTLAGRLAWVPRHQPGDVLHLGVTASREAPESSVNGLGLTNVPSARFRST